MKVIILCGGKGTRLREETEFKPKPMVEIGGRPVLWHIMSMYARYGHKDFVLPLGYKGEVIKQYFHDYRMRNADFTVDLATGSTTYHPTAQVTDWRVTMSDTGPETLKGARIKRIQTERIQTELDKRKIVLVAGFQGINKYGDVTTLGRGGSDTSAVALAAALHADLCQIYTDVDGVYTADPRSVQGARKLEEITYDEMLELATLGAQVLHNRSVEMAKRYGVNLEVLSSFSGKPGTKVKEVAKTMEKLHVSGVACDKNVARVAVVGLADEPGIAFKIFSLLAKERINVDLILQSIGRNNTKDISFTVSIQDVERCKQLLDEHRDFLQFDHVDVNDKIAKVSIVGAGMVHNPGVAAKMFEALYNAGINISMISTSEIKVSVLVDINEADRAVQVIHDRFFHEFGGN